MRRSRALFVVAIVAAAPALAMVACSGGEETSGTGGSGAGGQGTGGNAASGGTGGSLFQDAGDAGCVPGQSCDDAGGICAANGTCCAADSLCAGVCCGAGAICSFQQCVTPGASCVDATDCAQDEYCEYALGDPQGEGGGGGAGGGACQGGQVLATGRCLPKPPECGVGQDPGDPPSCVTQCEYVPPFSSFDPVVKYYWGAQNTPPYATDVMMAPIVAQLDDDNCDGKINERDIPEILFSTFTGGAYYKQGTLHAISIVDGQLVDKLTIPNGTQPGAGLAAGDLDGDGVPEIVACMNPGPSGASCCDALAQNTGVVAYRADGSVMWTQTDTTKVHCGYESPAIGNVDHQGPPEVLVGLTILDGLTGNVLRELDPATSWGARLTGLSDLDGDGFLDVVDGQRAFRADGTVLWDLTTGPDAIPRGYHAVGDFDLDGTPEVVIISSAGPHTMAVVHYDPASASGAAVLRKGVDINDGTSTAAYCGAASEYGGGPPTVADFNGDGTPDIGAAGAVGYIVFDGKLVMDPLVANADIDLWFKTTHDCSSAVTGSSVFDFNGDGAAEVIYSDEYHLWMYDGLTGTNLIPSTCNTTGTLWEYPLVADVDNDGQADIVLASNAYGITCPDNGSKQSGIRILDSASGTWVRTRRVWNQHTYHVTNVNEDGSIPLAELDNVSVPGLNDYRQNRQPEGEFSAPDLVVSVFPKCVGSYGLYGRVRNIGQASVPPGVIVGFYQGAPPLGTFLGTATTTTTLYALGTEDVLLPLPTPFNDSVYAVVDDGNPPNPWHECRDDNNVSTPVSASCAGIN